MEYNWYRSTLQLWYVVVYWKTGAVKIMATINQRADLVEKARQRHAELSKIIKAAEDVREEWNQLNAFILMADQMEERLSPKHEADNRQQSRPNVVAVIETAGMAVNGHSSNGHLTIPDRAEEIIRRRGPIHLKPLFKEMRLTGWKATGDDAKDLRNLASSLSTRKERFKNMGQNVWDVIKK